MQYYHRYIDNSRPIYPSGKVVCVGRNYVEHAKELNNPIPSEPILFMKPSSALWPLELPIQLPNYANDCQHEIEIAILIGKKLVNAKVDESEAAIAGYGLALDLTLRDIQLRLKQQGYPWERAKAFDGSCPMSPFIMPERIKPLLPCDFSLYINGKIRQQGSMAQMLWPVAELLAHISQIFTLLPGDVVLTGTPAGVGPLQAGDRLLLNLADRYEFTSQVIG
jgi:2-keto-4-pentenoate hydratase/2-oxohepta-3-ene-1,7-dioic acid hydratase in catechol pathway